MPTLIFILLLLLSLVIGFCLGWFSKPNTEAKIKLVSGRAYSLKEIISILENSGHQVLYDKEGTKWLALSFGLEGIKLTDNFSLIGKKPDQQWEWYKKSVEFFPWKEFFKLFPEVVDDRKSDHTVLPTDELKYLQKKAAIVEDAERELEI